MYLVDNAIEAGDFEEALRRAAGLPTAIGGTLPRTWEARYLVRLAYAQAELGHDGAAIEVLMAARDLADEWIRYYPLAASVVTELVNRPARPNPKLARLATHLRVL